MVEIKTTMHVVDEYLKKDRDYKDKQWVSLEDIKKELSSVMNTRNDEKAMRKLIIEIQSKFREENERMKETAKERTKRLKERTKRLKGKSMLDIITESHLKTTRRENERRRTKRIYKIHQIQNNNTRSR